MKKYFIILFCFVILDVILESVLGSKCEPVKFEQWYLILIFLEIPLYGTFILYEIKKHKNDEK